MPVIAYQLNFLTGPRAGESIALENGETILGRGTDCHVPLNLPGISKKHAKITVSDRTVMVEDLGSSNGTFVNGILVTRKQVSVGDKIVLPGVILTLNIAVREARVHLQATGSTGAQGFSGSFPPPAATPLDVSAPKTSFKETVQRAFLKLVQPMIDAVVRTYDWKTVVLALLGLFTVAQVFMIGFRFAAINHDAVKDEVKRRGSLLAKRMAELNVEALNHNDYSRLDIEKTLKEDGVLEALVSTPDGKIIAPASRYGESVPGAEWIAAVRTDGGGLREAVKDGTITSVIFSYPIPRQNPRDGKTGTGAVALVELSLQDRVMHFSETLTVIFTSLFIGLLLAGLVFVFLHRMTAQPFMDMADEIEQVLKGSKDELRVPIRFAEMETLVRSFNFLLNKVKSDRGSSRSMNQSTALPYRAPLDMVTDPASRFVVENASHPILILKSNQRLELLSKGAEQELMIPQSSAGQSILEACQDQTVLGNILEADKEARASNGLPYQLRFQAYGRDYSLEARAFFDEMGEHLRTILSFTREGG